MWRNLCKAVASMSGVESEFGTLGWAADWERRPDSNVQENKDKQEPRKLS